MAHDIGPAAVSAKEDRLLRALVRQHKLPPGVHGFDLEYGQDSTGYPSVWVLFVTDDDLKPPAAWIAQLSDLAHKVTEGILAAGTNRWPYVNFVPPPRAHGPVKRSA